MPMLKRFGLVVVYAILLAQIDVALFWIHASSGFHDVLLVFGVFSVATACFWAASATDINNRWARRAAICLAGLVSAPAIVIIAVESEMFTLRLIGKLVPSA